MKKTMKISIDEGAGTAEVTISTTFRLRKGKIS